MTPWTWKDTLWVLTIRAAITLSAYAAFFEQVEGAHNVLFFFIWVMAVAGALSAFLPKPTAVIQERGPWYIRTMALCFNLGLLVLLVWHGYIVTGTVWFIGWIGAEVRRDEFEKLRKAAQ